MAKAEEKVAAALAISDLVVAHGLPLALKLIQTLNADTATVEDLRALKESGLKPAEEFFDKPAGGE